MCFFLAEPYNQNVRNSQNMKLVETDNEENTGKHCEAKQFCSSSQSAYHLSDTPSS